MRWAHHKPLLDLTRVNYVHCFQTMLWVLDYLTFCKGFSRDLCGQIGQNLESLGYSLINLLEGFE